MAAAQVDPSTVSSLASVPNIQCAWCYAEVASPRRCGKCHKRPYSSRECQLHDWKLGHKHWCSISGENGYDFEVREVLGKGRGIFAKKCFERGKVVLMERPLPLAHGVSCCHWLTRSLPRLRACSMRSWLSCLTVEACAPNLTSTRWAAATKMRMDCSLQCHT